MPSALQQQPLVGFVMACNATPGAQYAWYAPTCRSCHHLGQKGNHNATGSFGRVGVSGDQPAVSLNPGCRPVFGRGYFKLGRIILPSKPTMTIITFES